MAIERLRPGTEEAIDEYAEWLARTLAPGSRVLDVGGSWMPLRCATHVLDLERYEQRRVDVGRGPLPELFKKDTWYVRDACVTPWPWPDNNFDYVWCCQVVEDVRDPVALCKEMMRVGKAGFISTVHRTYEQHAVQADGVVGYHHHRWLVELIDGGVVFTFKSPIIQHNQDFKVWQPLDWLLHFTWKGAFGVRENHTGGDQGQLAELVEFRHRLAKGGVE